MNLIDPVTLTLAGRALDAASQRHAVHANNIANAHAEGFAPGRVSFEAHLDQLRDALDSGAALTLGDVAQLPITVETAAPGTPVEVENEVAALARNALHYQALIKAVDRQLGMVSLAVSDGEALMDYRAAFEISAAGMSVEKTRLDISALNLANMHSAIAPGAQGYRPMRVLAQPLAADFANALNAENRAQVRSLSVVPMDSVPRMVSDPGHPYADERGFVRYPGVDQAAEMITAMTALRAYEANVAAAGMARAMASRALDIGGQR